ncbi:MAG: beta-ketoacyl synthase N-terminal-like domain-containing protein [Pirellulales bacterium]
MNRLANGPAAGGLVRAKPIVTPAEPGVRAKLPCQLFSRHQRLRMVGPTLFRPRDQREPIVITGMGLVTSVGRNRETTWEAIRQGVSGIRRVTGVPDIPDGWMLGAQADVAAEVPGELKVISMCRLAAREAIEDSGVDMSAVDRDRFGCAISGHMGDDSFVALSQGRPGCTRPVASRGIDSGCRQAPVSWLPTPGTYAVRVPGIRQPVPAASSRSFRRCGRSVRGNATSPGRQRRGDSPAVCRWVSRDAGTG